MDSESLTDNQARQLTTLYWQLTAKERQFIQHYATGLQPKQIACVMGVAPQTVSTHRTNVMRKLNVSNELQLVSYLMRAGLVPEEV
jgi:DNA-binding CsgD family transcriptional regulator